MTNKKIIIMAGGTGGHVFPGITIAEELLKKKWNICWIGTKNHIESLIIPCNKFPIYSISITGLHKTNLYSIIQTSFQLIRAYKQSKLIIEKYKPDLILGMGGYISAPGALVAYKQKIPLIIHEQNKIAGLTNKILSKLANKTLQAFPNTLKNAIEVGNPIRPELLNIPSPFVRFKNRKGPIRILVLGGSQGSMIINYFIPKVSLLLNTKILIWHQIGDNITTKLKKFYSIKRKNIFKTSTFIKDIKSAYLWADLIISRGGALTVSEISTIGLGAIFIPYPHKDKQQYWNTLPLYNIGAAKLIEEKNLTTKVLINTILQLNRKKLIFMAKKSYTKIHTQSTQKIIKIIEKNYLLSKAHKK
ncbi:UDP-N-acetylglucosamine--N-acetylmuramyl-(pentapeptide) pyrophosphoryl-undecaprenol N-acetylglucosamine transferase [Buchnera aphidicola (Nipponaphis monzeni)]|uniref:UDP-N-acetylglucosamine--N-acetylmuramyl-(pentapeptide) pyrophosphoryl-undecaprenol N-acetylglucosamine transferase n=1 Tax=Buchnera aphidicola (Nipponaphis monzeni) TaxID=2495405 RepID=A0A455TA52_9GAMM|nr:undecaprenyldiphospho-muramoylpentapeptide beta-N-acetylglucosaminyltransferase [Buchnera aphidicola]BBI01185.1 UDP-N-acetylglucosamine--N-acetylmuramyl-(pentapeptide) pyrophosphoryl-undecaprenol N-acetylglucosamine transferase [Buchnera aphidicola (Nipponaphis monzeni)]